MKQSMTLGGDGVLVHAKWEEMNDRQKRDVIFHQLRTREGSAMPYHKWEEIIKEEMGYWPGDGTVKHAERPLGDEPAFKYLSGLFAEVRADEHSARVREYGEADAATFDQRVRDGASTIRHLEPVAPEEIEKALTEVERSWPVAKETPAITGKAALERLLFGDKKPEPQQVSQTKNRGIEL